MKPLKETVLLNKVHKKLVKESKIIMLAEDKADPNQDRYSVTYIVTAISEGIENPDIKVGDTVYLSTYASPQHTERTSGKTGDEEVIDEVLINYEFIIGKD